MVLSAVAYLVAQSFVAIVEEYPAAAYDYNGCNIATVQISGELLPYDPTNKNEYSYRTISGDAIVKALDADDADTNIKGVILRIDSYGGSPAAASEVEDALKHMSKPTVAYIREEATSAAYIIASRASTTIADKYAGAIGGFDVGSLENKSVTDPQALSRLFVEDVAQNRHITTPAAESLADTPMTADQALKNGLVDQVGGMDAVVDWFTGKIGERAVVCR